MEVHIQRYTVYREEHDKIIMIKTHGSPLNTVNKQLVFVAAPRNSADYKLKDKKKWNDDIMGKLKLNLYISKCYRTDSTVLQLLWSKGISRSGKVTNHTHMGKICVIRLVTGAVQPSVHELCF